MSEKPSKFKNSNFYKELVKLREEMKPMTWKQKVDHIWTYYKEYIGLFALAIFVCTGLITSAVNARKDTVITGIMVNVAVEQEGYNYLSEDYAKHLGIKDEKKVRLEYTSFYDLETNPSEENYNAAMIVLAEVSAKKLDYMILDELGMKFYVGQEVYLDLSEVFTGDELKAFADADRLIYCMEEEEQVRWPAAIKITDLPFVKDNLNVEGDVYFALSGSTEKFKEIRQVWEYLNAYKAK